MSGKSLPLTIPKKTKVNWTPSMKTSVSRLVRRTRHSLILHSSLHKMAASFIGAVLASGIALAAIHIVHQYQKPETPQTTDTIAVASPQRSTLNAQPEEADTLAVEPRIFDNVPLDTMLLEMADYYHISVEFEREEARQLRFHFIWKRTDNLDRLVEKLNNFEAVNIIRESEKLIVK